MKLRYLPLLLAAGACQRASYVFPSVPAAVVCAPATCPPVPADSGCQPVSALPARAAPRAVLRRWRRPAALTLTHASPAVATPVARAQVPALAAPRQYHTAAARRRPAVSMSEDAKFFGLIIGAVLLLLAGGLWLIAGVGGGLAVAGGVGLLLLALLGAAFGLFAAGFKGRP